MHYMDCIVISQLNYSVYKLRFTDRTISSLKTNPARDTEIHHNANFVITDSMVACGNDNLQCPQ